MTPTIIGAFKGVEYLFCLMIVNEGVRKVFKGKKQTTSQSIKVFLKS